MKLRTTMAIILIVTSAVIFTACQSAAPATQTPDVGVPYPEATLQLQTPSDDIYPPPPARVVPFNPYPEPNDGDMLEWDHAEFLIKYGMVAEITQGESMKLVLILADGRSLTTVQPEDGAVLRAIEFCGQLCNDTIVK